VATLTVLPTLTTSSGASPAPGVIQGLIELCPTNAPYNGQITIALHHANGALSFTSSTLPKSRPTHFSWWTTPGDYYITVKSDFTLRWPYRVHDFRVSSGKTVQLPNFKIACTNDPRPL
jgi:hypothetical protein